MLWNIWTISNCCWWSCHSKKITNPNKILTIFPQPLVLSWCFPFIGIQPELAEAFEIKSFPGTPKYSLILEEKLIKILAQLKCSGFKNKTKTQCKNAICCVFSKVLRCVELAERPLVWCGRGRAGRCWFLRGSWQGAPPAAAAGVNTLQADDRPPAAPQPCKGTGHSKYSSFSIRQKVLIPLSPSLVAEMWPDSSQEIFFWNQLNT